MRLLASFLVGLVGLVALVALAAPFARADDRQQAAEHFALAESAERRGDWRSAIDEYGRAYALAPHPSVLYNIARDWERLSEWGQAVEFYRRYLADDPAAADRAAVEQRIAALEEKVKAARPPPRAGTGWLIVQARPDGAEVVVDGTTVGTTPLQVEVPAGAHHVIVRAPGHLPAQRDVTLAATGSEQIRESLTPSGEPIPEPSAPRRTISFVLGGEYGYSFGSPTQFRLAAIAGLRLFDLVEGDVLAGLLSNESLFGFENRIFFNPAPARFFSRLAFAVGTSTASADGDAAVRSIEGGLGVVWTTAAPETLRWGLQSMISVRVAFYEAPIDATHTSVIWAFGLLLH